MKTHQNEPREALIAQFDEFVDGVFAPLESWLPRLKEQLQERLAAGTMTGAQLSALTEQDAHALLEQTDRPLYGAGFCASDAVVTEGNPLAWWQGPDRQLLASSTFGPGQAAIDLERLEWFRLPAETREHHIAGPFVDYLCSNEITLTAAIPVEIGDKFVGVLCADVLVASLEAILLPLLADHDGAALVNSNGRVVVSAHPSYETGDRFLGEATITKSARYPFALMTPEQ